MKVLLNILTHGDERVGLKVAREIAKLRLKKGEVIVNRANELAYKKKKRFIDQDLNRSFPGKRNGNYEQRLAVKILPMVKSADIVIDIHSTRSGLKDALIVTKLNKKTREYIDVISPKYLLYMRATKNNALMSAAKIGIAFEYGKENDKKALEKIIGGMERLFIHLDMLDGKNGKRRSKIVWMDVYGTVPKPKGARLSSAIKNYKLVAKETEFASVSGEPIIAKEDFYPILFGKNSYKEIFGFSARLLK
jgi:predicted deacylase